MGRKVVLVMGLPGSGKTILAKQLSSALAARHFNADEIRALNNDWDFSYAGRIRQAERMKNYAMLSSSYYDICDFVAALRKQRDILNADFVIWMDTIKTGRFEDTNKAFEDPSSEADLIITNWEYDINSIVSKIRISDPQAC